jgi:hypothetical protein
MARTTLGVSLGWMLAAAWGSRRAALLLSCPQALAQFLQALRAGEQAFQQRAQVQTGSAHHDRSAPAPLDVVQHLACAAGVFAGGHIVAGIDGVKQVMRCAGAFCRRWFGAADVEVAIDGDRIAVDDFAGEALGQRQRQRGLAAACRADDGNQQRLHSARAPRDDAGPARQDHDRQHHRDHNQPDGLGARYSRFRLVGHRHIVATYSFRKLMNYRFGEM